MQRACPLCVISERILRIGGKNAGKLCDKSPYRFGNEAFKPFVVRIQLTVSGGGDSRTRVSSWVRRDFDDRW